MVDKLICPVCTEELYSPSVHFCKTKTQLSDDMVDKSKGKCKKTFSGKHLFWPILELPDVNYWKVHGVEKPMRCIACGVINDLIENEKS